MSGAAVPAPEALVTLDVSSPVPPYEQIRLAVADLVAAGRLPAGSRLPSVRQLAGDLGVAAGTVARAYRELTAAGVVASLGARGTVVQAIAAPPDVGSSALEVASRRLVTIARSLGLSVRETEALVRAAWLRSPGPDSLPQG